MSSHISSIHHDTNHVAMMDDSNGSRTFWNNTSGKSFTYNSNTLSTLYADAGLWEATDPTHRACILGSPCAVTGEKSCGRISYLAKYHHFYGTCGAWSEDHVFCRGLTSDDEKHVFPACAECGILIEVRGLILINRRLLDDRKQIFTSEDIRIVQNELAGYIRAYEARRTAHVLESRNKADDLFEAEINFAREGIDGGAISGQNRKSSWLVFVHKVVGFLRGYARLVQ